MKVNWQVFPRTFLKRGRKSERRTARVKREGRRGRERERERERKREWERKMRGRIGRGSRGRGRGKGRRRGRNGRRENGSYKWSGLNH